MYIRSYSTFATTLLLFFVLTPGILSAQSKQTPNTLKLDSNENRPKASIEAISWLAGYWTGDGLGGACEEIWSAPLGNSMMGSYRLVKDRKVVFQELCTIVEEDGSLVLKVKHFDAGLKGWEEKDKAQAFPLVKLTGTEAYFSGITFRKMADGSLQAYVAIENQKTGPAREAMFTYHLRDEKRVRKVESKAK